MKASFHYSNGSVVLVCTGFDFGCQNSASNNKIINANEIMLLTHKSEWKKQNFPYFRVNFRLPSVALRDIGSAAHTHTDTPVEIADANELASINHEKLHEKIDSTFLHSFHLWFDVAFEPWAAIWQCLQHTYVVRHLRFKTKAYLFQKYAKAIGLISNDIPYTIYPITSSQST